MGKGSKRQEGLPGFLAFSLWAAGSAGTLALQNWLRTREEQRVDKEERRVRDIHARCAAHKCWPRATDGSRCTPALSPCCCQLREQWAAESAHRLDLLLTATTEEKNADPALFQSPESAAWCGT